MKNLAGIPTDDANAAIIDELASAGVDAVPVALDSRHREVLSTVDGLLRFGDRAFAFRRAWVYWCVSPAEGSPALTLDDAEAIDGAPYDGERGHYCGHRGCLGDVARWAGFAGGIAPREFWPSSGWHVDTQAGLDALDAALRARFGGAP